ncbi:LOW QUALITY PROTEIN: hypothetical protein PHMEG_00021791 [Phytophthora megakarya]|uniref:Eukaryotic/viral aspartic protease n=1 Tax=Phytophthora megakarya TaxID=4795 RepID=A0A225VKZ3_9STRA|nr:LOW QUALITY PROTEIN: hypothetical protein PHMEG_00021791 [Phytophthora megakarya]
MVRVPGPSGDSGFHRESQEEVQVKTEQGNEMSTDARSTTTSLKARSADRQSARRNSVDGSGADLDPNPYLEEKPHPPQVSDKETSAHPDSRQDPLSKQTKVKAEPYSFIDPDKPTLYMPKDTQIRRKPRSKTARKKMKAPDDEEDDDHPGSGWSEEDLKSTYHHKELRDFVDQDSVMRILKLKRFSDPKDPVTAPATLANTIDATVELIRLVREAGMIPGSFDADTLFDLELDVIQATSRDLFQKLKILVGEAPQSPDPLPPTTTDAVDNLTVSSHYASAAESDISSEPPRRMSLDPSGASMLEARSQIRRSSPARNSRRDNRPAPTDQATVTESSDRSGGTLLEFFNAAMDRYLAEEREANKDPASTRPQHQGSQDVEMESIRSSDHGSRWEYHPA